MPYTVNDHIRGRSFNGKPLGPQHLECVARFIRHGKPGTAREVCDELWRRCSELRIAGVLRGVFDPETNKTLRRDKSDVLELVPPGA